MMTAMPWHSAPDKARISASDPSSTPSTSSNLSPSPTPPPQDDTLRQLVDQCAEYFVQGGVTWEETARRTQAGNPHYVFLWGPGYPYHDYYRWRQHCIRAKLSPEQIEAAVRAHAQHAAATQPPSHTHAYLHPSPDAAAPSAGSAPPRPPMVTRITTERNTDLRMRMPLTSDTMPVGLLHSLQKTINVAYTPINPSHIPPIAPPAGPANPEDMSDVLRDAVGSFYRSIYPDYGTEAVDLAHFRVNPNSRKEAVRPDAINTGWHDKTSEEWLAERERRRERRRRMREEAGEDSDEDEQRPKASTRDRPSSSSQSEGGGANRAGLGAKPVPAAANITVIKPAAQPRNIYQRFIMNSNLNTENGSF